MWYEILLNNEFADYFMNSDGLESNKEKDKKMLQDYEDIILGITYAWVFYEDKQAEKARKNIKSTDENILKAFEFCRSQMHLTETKALGDLWQSACKQFNVASPYEVDVELLSAEQCAFLIIYPFWARMGYSFLDEFQESGDLKKYLLALKRKKDRD